MPCIRDGSAVARSRISVVIPVFDEASALPQLAVAVRAYQAAGHECVVVDGYSSDASVALAGRFADCVITAPRGRAAQMNAGARVARGEVLWFLHADTVPPPQAIDLILTQTAAGAHWGYFDVGLSGSMPLFRVIERLMNLRVRVTGIATGDHGIFVRRDLFEAIGAFPEIPLMEDIALSRSLKAYARPVRLQPPVRTSSRRWEQGGVLRTVLRMWLLRLAYALGVAPTRLARFYR